MGMSFSKRSFAGWQYERKKHQHWLKWLSSLLKLFLKDKPLITVEQQKIQNTVSNFKRGTLVAAESLKQPDAAFWYS